MFCNILQHTASLLLNITCMKTLRTFPCICLAEKGCIYYPQATYMLSNTVIIKCKNMVTNYNLVLTG